MKCLFISIIVLLVSINLGMCLECFFGDPEDFDNDNLRNSTYTGEPLMSCVKITKQMMNGSYVDVERNGVPTKKPNGCSDTGYKETCYCDTDACNTAHTSATVLPFLILPAVVTYFL